YESFAGAWPNRTEADAGPGEAGFIDRINSFPKYVVSTTLKQLGWNNSHLIKGNVAEEVAKLKQSGLNIVMYGAGPLAHMLLQHGLIDELRVDIYPVVARVTDKTRRLFNDAGDIPILKLMATRTFNSGIVVHEYQVALNA